MRNCFICGKPIDDNWQVVYLDSSICRDCAAALVRSETMREDEADA